MSKNKPTIRQLQLACRHINEQIAAGMSLNHAIRLLELIADVYAMTHEDGKANVWHPKRVPSDRWSIAARREHRAKPNVPTGTYLRVEHGTPRRQFAGFVRELHKRRRLNAPNMARLIKRYWKMAVITHEEDRRLKRRNKFKNPVERWAEARIRFPKDSPNGLS